MGPKPDSCTAAKLRYSITLSAVANSLGGIVRLSTFAFFAGLRTALDPTARQIGDRCRKLVHRRWRLQPPPRGVGKGFRGTARSATFASRPANGSVRPGVN